ncbi:MAG: homocysteine biosynthesis protein, partial [Candidatus Hodarchaeota archaeon]
GTQHNPGSKFGTLFLKGDLKKMNSEYLKGAIFSRYGTTVYIGVGVPIPILNEKIAKNCAIKDSEIITEVIDYGVPRRDKPMLGKTSYEELKSGTITINEKKVRVKPLSSFKKALEISNILRDWITDGKFLLGKPVELVSNKTQFKPMRSEQEISFVKDLYQESVCCRMDDSLNHVAKLIVKQNADHVIVVDEQKTLRGILTSFDITKAVAYEKSRISEIVTKKVISVKCNETLYEVARKLKKYNISALPVVDNNNKVLGIISESMLIKNLVPKPSKKAIEEKGNELKG